MKAIKPTTLIPLLIVSFCCAGVAQPVPTKLPAPSLGHASVAPAGLSRPKPGGVNPLLLQVPQETGPFSVNSDSREQVRAFYNGIYPTSENIPENSTADQQNCTPGTNSTAFEIAVLRRINWFRAMDGMPANITFDTQYNQQAQQMAVMISANMALNHNPPSSWTCYTQAGDAVAGGNQAEGVNGPDAITDYIWEFGGSNADVGHRRWILWPPQTVMGTGDVPAEGSLAAANSTWVFGGSSAQYPATRHPYCSWPPEGYIPYLLVFPYWSFSYPNANFSNTVVTMKSNNVPVSVGSYNNTDGYGDNTLCWVPMGLNTTGQSLPAFPFGGTDTVYSVTVSNVQIGSFFSNFTYNVTLFDPTLPGTDYVAAVVSGPVHPTVNAANLYTCVPINNSNVTTYEWIVSQLQSTNVFENANADNNNGGTVVNFTFSTVGTANDIYPLIDSAPDGSTNYCIHLCNPDATSQFLTLNHPLLPATNTTVSFSSMLGYATSDETAALQISTNGGVTWTNLYSLAGNGNEVESSFNTHTYSLSNYAGIQTLLQFAYLFTGGEYYPNQTANYLGWSLESITITNASEYLNSYTNVLTSTNITSGNLADNANNGLTNFTTSLWPSYSFITNAPDGSGNCFHMTHDDYTVQFLQLNETLIPMATASVSFKSMLGYASTDETARVQVSTNGGVSWMDLFAEPGCFSGSQSPTECETTFSPHTLSLAPYAGRLTLLRFYYDFCCNYESFPGQANNYFGWNIENIVITNCQQQVVQPVNTTNFTFYPTQAGTYVLQPVPVLFNDFPLQPATQYTVTAGGITLNSLGIANTQVTLNFGTLGITNTTFHLLQSTNVRGPWLTNTVATLATNVIGSQYHFTATRTNGTEFYRIKSP